MEEKKHTEQQPILQQEERKPQSVVISSGIIIQSKLNPAAKEFYPSHVTRRNQMFQEIIKETKSSEEILERMQNDFTDSGGGSRVRECGLINFSETVEPKANTVAAIQQQIGNNDAIVKIDSEEVNKNIERNLKTDLKFLVQKNAVDDFKNDKVEEIVQKTEELPSKDKINNFKDMQDVRRNVDDKVCGDCLTVGDEKKEEKRDLVIETVCDQNKPTACKAEDDDMAAMIKKIEEEINADKTNDLPNANKLEAVELKQTKATTELTTKATAKVETAAANARTVGTAKTVGTVKPVETIRTVEVAKTMETAKAIEKAKTTEISKAANTTQVAPKAKTTASPRAAAAATNVEAKVDKHVDKEQVKKITPTLVKKEGGLRKISKIALSSIKKTTSSTSSHSTTSTNSANTASANAAEKSTAPRSGTMSSNMSRTKRISESLHNLSSTFKSKTDIKTNEAAAAKATQRSTTTIPKSAVRSRTLINKTSDTNGIKKEATASKMTPQTKDAISLKSTSSTEKSITSKSSFTPSTHSSSSKTLHSKISTTSTKSSDSKSSTSSKNSKDSAQKLPRGTVASSLRQTEAQKVS